MVGLVIVSHSAQLAAGVAELARGMAGPDARIAATGGLALPDSPLGTDAALVHEAIEKVYSDDGVLVLMDLGSAVLSAEMALDMLSPEQRARVKLCEAPLVEGAIAAAVQARLNSPLAQVAAEARNALGPKVEQLAPTGAAVPAEPGSGVPAAAAIAAGQHLRLVVPNRLGLHARPAARFVQTVGRFPAEVRLTNVTTGRGPVNAKSINAVATLGVRQGHEIEIVASGSDAEAVLDAIKKLADDNFGDVEAPSAAARAAAPAPPSAAAVPPSALRGLPASPGLAHGPARLFRAAQPSVPQHAVADPQAEWDKLVAAIEKTHAQISANLAAVARRADRQTADIFEAHLLFLDDDALRTPARRAIFDAKLNAAAAWQLATQAVAAEYRALADEYMRARAADLEDVGWQVIRHVLGIQPAPPPLTEAGILVAADLTPADTAQLDVSLVRGLCTAYGGPTAHSAILARSFGIPAVVGAGEALLRLTEGTPLIIDGDRGDVIPDPDPATTAEYARRLEAARSAAAEARAASAALAVTHDGRRIEVAANIGSPADARAAVAAGAEGVGLFRTEFLFLDRRTGPDEAEQFAAYRAAAEALGRDRPLVIRTLDVGGDKPLPYIDIGAEANPFLGWRAVRLCLAQPEFFKVQLRAIIRAAAEFPQIKVMFPMIASLAEFRAAKALLLEAAGELRARGETVPGRIETGIMVEIPAAAIRSRQFAAEVDFFSIGTNDLTQYTLAVDRGNARVAAFADAFHPAVLDLIQQTAEAAHAHGKWVGVCGEMAGDPLAVPLLVGLGIDELSMAPPAIPRAKQIIRSLDTAAARAKALAALALETPGAVRAALSG